MSSKREHRTILEYLKYLKGELTPLERHSLERDLEADPFDMEAMEGLESLAPGEAEEDLLSLHATLNRRLRRRRRIRNYSIAASVASLLIVGTFFIHIYDFSPEPVEESLSDDVTLIREESATQDAEREEGNDLLEQGAPDRTEDEQPGGIPVKEEISVQKKGQVQENARVPDSRIVQDEALPEEYAGDLNKAPVREDNAVYRDQAIEVAGAIGEEGREAPAPVAVEIVSVEALPKRSQNRAKAKEAPSLQPTDRVSGIAVSSGERESLPGAAMMGKEGDAGMMAEMDSFNEVVVVGYGTGEEADDSGAVRKVQPDQQEFKYNRAEPEGGLDAFKRYIEEHIRFPAGDTLNTMGVVVLKFNVEADGTLSDIQTLRSTGDPFTEEALRLIQQGPAWNPARNASGPTGEVVRLRLEFRK